MRNEANFIGCGLPYLYSPSAVPRPPLHKSCASGVQWRKFSMCVCGRSSLTRTSYVRIEHIQVLPVLINTKAVSCMQFYLGRLFQSIFAVRI